ncbi:MAG TPA: SGNH/GDSL hydrolase family protein [Longimicrobium sp.]|jgi:lysophospholipase L1-like esterase
MKPGKSRLRLLAVAAAALSLGACVGDGDERITLPTPANGAIFSRYIALGNSITAGYQSGGIVDTLQQRSYAVLLAERAGITNFGAPLVAQPGCGPLVPFTAPLTPSAPTGTCARSAAGAQVDLVQNVAVPGARLIDLLRFPPGQLGQVNTVLVGPRTQVRAMQEARPTFVSVWVGNNDALEATVGGLLGATPTRADSSLTPLATFRTQLNQLVDSIKAAAPTGVMLVGVVDAIQGAPIIQPGAYFFLSRDAEGKFQGKPVNNNCSPVTALGQPNPLSRNYVSFQAVTAAGVTEIDCSGNTAGGAFVLDANEQAIVAQRVRDFNTAIEAAATANGWLYVNPNPILASFLTTRDAQGRAQRIRKCQGLLSDPPPATVAALQVALVTTCPVPPTGATANFAAPNFFGSLMSFDGVHPSTEAHRVLAGRFAAAINAKYGTTLSTSET